MPITRKQFELQVDAKTEEWMDKIRGFLAEHKDEAFTEKELRQYYSEVLLERLSEFEKKMLQASGSQDPFHISSDEKTAFDLALERLVDIRMAEKRIIRGTEYYAYSETVEDIPF